MYRGFHWAKPTDLLRWHDEGRRDILQYVAAGRDGTGRLRTATDLERTDLERLGPVSGWTDPVTGTVRETCPFLVQADPTRYLCSIHPTKPQVCQETNTWEWGFGRYGPWGCPVSPP